MDNITDLSVDGIKISKKDGHEYCSNPALLKQIMISKEQDQLTDDAIKMLMLMVKNIQNKKFYAKDEEREDCFQSAMMDCVLYWRGFDPEKSNNPFSYFTSIISNGIAKGWNMLHPEGKNKNLKGAIFTSLDNNIYSI